MITEQKSFAHPNTLLNYDKSLLIFKYVAGLFKYLNSLEQKKEVEESVSETRKAKIVMISTKIVDDLPF